jgi:hypothetical protein
MVLTSIFYYNPFFLLSVKKGLDEVLVNEANYLNAGDCQCCLPVSVVENDVDGGQVGDQSYCCLLTL